MLRTIVTIKTNLQGGPYKVSDRCLWCRNLSLMYT